MNRLNWVPAPAMYNLNMACMAINEALGDGGSGCFHVGSSLERRDYRDVDVRYIMKDEAWDKLFGTNLPDRPDMNALWSLMCAGISCWLQQQTGLPVDFQIQRASNANAEHPGKRHLLGMFLRPVPRDYAESLAKP